MRAILFTSAALALIGCKPPESLPTATTKEAPAAPSKKLSLEDARRQMIGEKGMNREQVKKLMGPPDATKEVNWGPNRVFCDMWIYHNQTVIWDTAAEKYYPQVGITFVRLSDGRDSPAVEVRIN